MLYDAKNINIFSKRSTIKKYGISQNDIFFKVLLQYKTSGNRKNKWIPTKLKQKLYKLRESYSRESSLEVLNPVLLDQILLLLRVEQTKYPFQKILEQNRRS